MLMHTFSARRRRARWRHALAVAAMTVAIAACSGNSPVVTEVLPSTTATTAAPTTIDANATVIFGSGSVPETLPADFPIPAESVIGGTMIDYNRNLTELILRVPAGLEALVGFFDTNLPTRGYEIVSSAGTATNWEVEFSNDAVTGTIAISLAAQDIAQAVVQVTATG